MASIMARARWARPVPRLSPVMVPRAPGSQCGLPSPVKAGTTTTPSEDVDRAGQRLELGGLVDDAEPVPQPLDAGAGHEHRALDGVGHGDCGPAAGPPSAPMATSPSVPRSQARVVTSPSTGGGQVAPAFMRTKLPVPKVALVMPRSKQAWPNRAACWSPIMALTGTPASGEPVPTASAATVPNRPQDGRTSASAVRGTPNRSHSSSDHRRTTMSKSRVREALVTSVANTPPSGPPVRFQRTHVSTVARARSGPVGHAALLEQPLHLGGREVGVEDQTGLLADQREMAGVDEVGAPVGRAAVLPDERPVEGGTRSAGPRPRPSRAGW